MRTDYLVDDETSDLRIEDGDFVKGSSAFQEIKMIMRCAPGEIRQYPFVGVMVDRFKNTTADRKIQFTSEVTQQLKDDGFKVESVDTSATEWWKNFTVNADE